MTFGYSSLSGGFWPLFIQPTRTTLNYVLYDISKLLIKSGTNMLPLLHIYNQSRVTMQLSNCQDWHCISKFSLVT